MKKNINKKLALLLALFIPFGVKSAPLIIDGIDYSYLPDLTGKIDVSKMVDKDIIPLDYPNYLILPILKKDLATNSHLALTIFL